MYIKNLNGKFFYPFSVQSSRSLAEFWIGCLLALGGGLVGGLYKYPGFLLYSLVLLATLNPQHKFNLNLFSTYVGKSLKAGNWNQAHDNAYSIHVCSWLFSVIRLEHPLKFEDFYLHYWSSIHQHL